MWNGNKLEIYIFMGKKNVCMFKFDDCNRRQIMIMIRIIMITIIIEIIVIVIIMITAKVAIIVNNNIIGMIIKVMIMRIIALMLSSITIIHERNDETNGCVSMK